MTDWASWVWTKDYRRYPSKKRAHSSWQESSSLFSYSLPFFRHFYCHRNLKVSHLYEVFERYFFWHLITNLYFSIILQWTLSFAADYYNFRWNNGFMMIIILENCYLLSIFVISWFFQSWSWYFKFFCLSRKFGGVGKKISEYREILHYNNWRHYHKKFLPHQSSPTW